MNPERHLSACLAGLGMLVLAGAAFPLAGQDDVKWGTGAWELAYFTGQLNDEPEFGPKRGVISS